MRRFYLMTAICLAGGLLLARVPGARGAVGLDNLPSIHYACDPDWESQNPDWRDWQAYGFKLPGDPVYGFGQGDPFDHDRYDFLSLAAKGNIVIGDYTRWEALRDQWASDADPDNNFTLLDLLDSTVINDKIERNFFPQNQLTRPYIVDPTDEALGYVNHGWTQGTPPLPMFDGNYNQPDRNPDPNQPGQSVPGTKLDGDLDPTNNPPRKFYESSLPDDELRKIMDPNLLLDPTKPLGIDDPGHKGLGIHAVLFTNHAITGYLPVANIIIQGAVVARDDALIHGNQFHIIHDTRLLGSLKDPNIRPFFLPVTFERPTSVKWEEVIVKAPTETTALPLPKKKKTKGGSSVLCTELFRQGALPKAWFLADTAYGLTYVEPSTMAVYHAWGVPVARLLHHSSVASAVAKPFILAWAQHMAYVMGATDTDSPVGHLLTAVGLPIHRALGQRQ